MMVVEAEKLAEDFRREQDAKVIIEEIVTLIGKRALAWRSPSRTEAMTSLLVTIHAPAHPGMLEFPADAPGSL